MLRQSSLGEPLPAAHHRSSANTGGHVIMRSPRCAPTTRPPGNNVRSVVMEHNYHHYNNNIIGSARRPPPPRRARAPVGGSNGPRSVAARSTTSTTTAANSNDNASVRAVRDSFWVLFCSIPYRSAVCRSKLETCGAPRGNIRRPVLRGETSVLAYTGRPLRTANKKHTRLKLNGSVGNLPPPPDRVAIILFGKTIFCFASLDPTVVFNVH